MNPLRNTTLPPPPAGKCSASVYCVGGASGVKTKLSAGGGLPGGPIGGGGVTGG